MKFTELKRGQLVEVQSIMPVQGYGKYYTTGHLKIPVEINGIKTNISHFLKDGHRLLYVYCIQKKSGEYVHLDIRSIPNFPDHHYEIMMNEGIEILKKHISENPNSYENLL